jgi:ATP/maltotriose-dependent transcriptional regulator MalT
LVNRIKEDGVFIHPEKTPGNIFREMGQSSLENNLCFSIGSLPMLIRKLFAEGDNKGITQLVNNIESIADLNQWRKWALVWPVLTIDLAVAYSRLVEGRLQEADALLSQLKQTAEKNGRKGNLIEILLLQALTLQAQDKIHQATELVIQAMQLAEPEGYFRVFVDMGTSMIHLLKEITLQEINLQYVHRLLAEFDRVRINQIFQIDSLVEPLTRREFEILSLLADDLTNLEIAQRLVISIGTVKTHTHNIYAKLGVRNRHQAIKRATELNMV